MSEQHAHSWWAEVEDVRAGIERRRAAGRHERTASPGERAPGVVVPAPTAPPEIGGPATGAAAGPGALALLLPAEVRPRRTRRTVRITGHGSLPPAPPRPLAEAGGPRRVSRPGASSRRRPDRLAAWAVLLGLAMVLVAAGSAHGATNLGDRTLKAPMEGRDVRLLQLELRRLGLLGAGATGHYGSLTRRAVRRFQRSRCLDVDGIAGATTIEAIREPAQACAADRETATPDAPSATGALHRRVVTWYGPGWYGRRTACGQRLTSRLIGVAHRSLPCGTRVRLTYAGRTVVAPVVDRGPFAAGVHYDLTWAAARRLGVIEAGRAAVRADH